MTSTDFFQKLDEWEGKIPITALKIILNELEITPEEVQPFVQFGENRYRRNLMKQGNAYQALVICWKNGQRSPIHNHKGSSCGVRVIKGVATETIFALAPNDLIYPTDTEWLYEGEVTGSDNEDIHQISNLQDHGKDLITLHIYTPSLSRMDYFSLESNRVASFDDPVYMINGGGI